MKKLLTSVAMVLLLAGCAKEYNDSGLRERIGALETRVTALEGNILSLQSAIGDGVFVAKVQEYADPETGKTIGVTVTYTNGDVKYFEISPKADYAGPVLGVITNGAGELVWAVDGIAIQIDGKEVPVYQTPVFSLDEEGFLWVEVAGKKAKLGQVQNEGATLKDGIFTDIKVEADKVVLTLSDNSVVNIPFAEAFKLNIETTEFTFDTPLQPIEIPYTVSAKTEGTEVGVAGYNPKEFNVAVEEDKIVVTPLKYDVGAVMMAYADSKIGLTSVVKLTVETEGIEIVDTPTLIGEEVYDYIALGVGEDIEAHVVSNVEFDAVAKNDWIHVVETKGTLHTIVIRLDENPKEEERDGVVALYKKGVEQSLGLVQLITIWQDKGEAQTGPANLSKKESANSYLVYAPGEYKFKAVKGNSTESVGTVAKVEILWETVNTDTAPAANSIIASVAYADGYVSFSTPEALVPGNALIAAKDANDDILWSWLIWIPGSEIKTVDAGFAGEKALMDRNLGAIVVASTSEKDVAAEGLYYQWGRPTPLLSKTKNAVPAIDYAANYTTTACADVATGIKTPLMFYHVEGKDWLVAPDNTLWGATKTQYDPCPPGYMVPGYDATLDMWKKVSDADFTTLWNYAEAAAYCQFKTAESVFPLAGYINGDGQDLSGYGKRALVWSHVAADDNKARGMFIRENKYYSDGNHKASGASVRCVVANEAAIVPPTPNPGDEPGGGEDPQPETPAVDLSETATANCYIVSEAGAFKFKTVKGNGTESVGTVATAEILWETCNNAEEVAQNSVIASVAYADDYITFSTPETLKPGNALIAAKDAEGKILWSWHIWIPKTVPAGAFYGLSETKMMMDRNIGALDAPAKDSDDAQNAGLFYQWGRKDPLRAVSSLADGTLAKTYPADVWTESSTQLTADNMHETPCTFIKGSEDWINVSDKTLWGDAKTINDPCPAGYKVPQRSATTLFDYLTPDETYLGWSVNNEKYYFSIGIEATSYTVFPFGHFSRGSSYDPNSDGRAWIWTATTKSDTEMTLARTIVLHKTDPKLDCSGQKKANGAYVRCIAEAVAE